MALHDVPRALERRRSALALFVLSVCAVVLFSGFASLGTWQVKRRAWKLDLIARVEQRVHAPPAAVPPASDWPDVTAAHDEYRHVRARGTFLNDAETLVQATTERGAGFWVLTPLRLADGGTVLVNRGFVAPERRDRSAHGAGEPTSPATVTGLLRMSEPGGALLRRNDPGANRWYSRDVQAIAMARGLTRVAPFFIDADAADKSDNAPIGGLTVIAFHNSHLIYAITWYTLALMVAGGAWIAMREELRVRRGEAP